MEDNNELVPLLLVEARSFIAGEDDILPINDFKDFTKQFYVESVKLWYLAAPAIFTSVCQYSLGATTQLLAGHVGTIQLAAVSVENSVIAGFSFGILMGMGSALETLCGQAYGAGQLEMLGIYMQRSWVILLTTAMIMMLVYIFAAPILLLIGQTPAISTAAGSFSIWMIPQLFAYAMVFPLAKFLQAQSKMIAMAVIAAAALILHIIFSWLLMLKLDMGLPGAAVVLNGSWWFIVAAQIVYILSGTCGDAWSGFSWKAFQNLWGFLKLSLASAVMLCLEFWYFNVLILFAGYLKNAEIAVDSISVCMNILGWTVMVAFGFNAAISVRVSNELGAAHPRTAKFSVIVATITSLVFGLLMALVLMVFRRQYPALFANSIQVQQLVYEITPLLALSIVISNVQPTLSGVAIGAGWQAYVAYVNLVSYYVFGIPLGLLLAYIMDMGVKGIWYGMIGGTGVQTCFLFWMIYRTNWNKEASMAEGRIKEWGTDQKINKDKVQVVA
ncbi:protein DETOXIFICATION 30-like [Impatiens glandulifera]|uniref:protein DETOXIFICATION 30-like n=1 Tax=Impatiens glandulifera TaxID=253017 RepID=UPI001FB1942F|nr:protein DETOXIFICATION 30-like [Impatiens glandulifera]